MPRDEAELVRELVAEASLEPGEARLYVRMLTEGSLPKRSAGPEVSRLVEKGMVILSGDNSRFIPVHPRLAVANHYRTWREKLVREINEKRMRVDRLILELIPLYEAMNEKKLAGGRGRD